MTTRRMQAQLKSPPRRSCEGEVVAKRMDADPVEDWLLAEAEIDAAEAAAKR